MITLYYLFGLFFFLLISVYVFSYKDIDYKVDVLRAEWKKTGYIPNEYKLHLVVAVLKILFLSYVIIGLFSYHTIYFLAIAVLMFITRTNWHYQIKKAIYFIILAILFIILYSYFK